MTHRWPLGLSPDACDTLRRELSRRCPAVLRSQREDLAQATALRLVSHARTRPEAELGEAYVRRSARHAITDALRKELRRDAWMQAHSAQLAADAEPDPERRLLAREAARTLQRELEALPAARREVVALYVTGHGVTEIAQRLRCNRKRADNLLRRGLATLREALADAA